MDSLWKWHSGLLIVPEVGAESPEGKSWKSWLHAWLGMAPELPQTQGMDFLCSALGLSLQDFQHNIEKRLKVYILNCKHRRSRWMFSDDKYTWSCLDACLHGLGVWDMHKIHRFEGVPSSWSARRLSESDNWLDTGSYITRWFESTCLDSFIDLSPLEAFSQMHP